jgi:hypothetical protein
MFFCRDRVFFFPVPPVIAIWSPVPKTPSAALSDVFAARACLFPCIRPFSMHSCV